MGGILKSTRYNIHHLQTCTKVFIRTFGYLGYKIHHIPICNNVKSCTMWDPVMLSYKHHGVGKLKSEFLNDLLSSQLFKHLNFVRRFPQLFFKNVKTLKLFHNCLMIFMTYIHQQIELMTNPLVFTHFKACVKHLNFPQNDVDE